LRGASLITSARFLCKIADAADMRAEEIPHMRDARARVIDICASRQRRCIKLSIHRLDQLRDIVPMLAGHEFGRKQTDQVQ